MNIKKGFLEQWEEELLKLRPRGVPPLVAKFSDGVEELFPEVFAEERWLGGIARPIEAYLLDSLVGRYESVEGFKEFVLGFCGGEINAIE
jgi:hypothetical protein